MRQKTERHQDAAERTIKDIRRQTRKHYSSEEKIRIVLAGLRGEDSIAELCRQEGIAQGLYYSWSKEFLEAGKKRLAGDTARAANSDEVKDLRRESRDLKEVDAVGIGREGQLERVVGVIAVAMPVDQAIKGFFHLSAPSAARIGVRQVEEHVAVDYLSRTT